jgi:hypothetical protein
MNFALTVPGSLVVHKVRGETHMLKVHAASVRGSLTCLGKGC